MIESCGHFKLSLNCNLSLNCYLCNPFKYDLRCASLYGVDFVFKNERRERGRIFERVTRLSISYISVNIQRDIISTLTPAVSMSCLEFAFLIPAQTSVHSKIPNKYIELVSSPFSGPCP